MGEVDQVADRLPQPPVVPLLLGEISVGEAMPELGQPAAAPTTTAGRPVAMRSSTRASGR
ncbi:hypothetical protein OHA25_27280 [Nonomuraea sp. NBC_00507]|uniref:hypothetical protein n=1 Tax=Nonomuraea sp. NBC_00507 TaxID=2976002 RepID=UPI002E189892